MAGAVAGTQTTHGDPETSGIGWMVVGYRKTGASIKDGLTIDRTRFPIPIDNRSAKRAFNRVADRLDGDFRFVYFGVGKPEGEFDMSTPKTLRVRKIRYPNE